MILNRSLLRCVAFAMAALALCVVGAASSQAQPPIVQPGAPGEVSREISAEAAADLAGIRYSGADVMFLQGMISHHAQALEMTELLESRSARDVMRQLAQRIALSQADEIEMMQEWLRERSLDVTALDAHHAPGAERMPGMLTDEEMATLEQADGAEFDRLFLELMIKHHQGALTMVENLLDQRGSAQDSQLFAFTADITSDQSMEIDRMDGMLRGLSSDPRVDLAAGFRDAGEASWNMTLVAALPKPDGFFDPYLPAGRPLSRGPETESDEQAAVDDSENASAGGASAEGEIPAGAADAESQEDAEDHEEAASRPPMLSFSNTDLAFSGDMLFEGNYHGFSTYRVEVPSSPQLVSSVVCPGGQGDVSVVGDLLIMSVEQTRGRLDCGLQGVSDPVSAERFRGVRIFDISSPRSPRQVAAVQTCRGSHTHTLVNDPDDEGNVYVYGSGTSSVRPGEELEGCSDESPAEDPNTSMFRIDVIRIPMSNPEEAAIVNRPFIFADPETGVRAGLWAGGDHGPGTQTTRLTNQCHDITVYPEIGLAAGACSGNGILLDISDPMRPERIDEVIDPGFAYWHSATFNNDGTKVIFTDEWGGGGRARCRALDPRNWGANAIFDIVDRKMEFRSYYKLPAPQSEHENCVAHNGSLVPVPGRDIMVQAWYQGGVSVFDFTDSSNPVEIAFFDRGPVDPEKLVMGGYWSTYWYRGFVYGTEIARGLDVLELQPSEYLTRNELVAASLVAPPTFNAQQQRRIDWGPRPVVAQAYRDQLSRTESLASEQSNELSVALERAELVLSDGAQDLALASELETLAATVSAGSGDAAGRSQARLRALAETLLGLAERLR